MDDPLEVLELDPVGHAVERIDQRQPESRLGEHPLELVGHRGRGLLDHHVDRPQQGVTRPQRRGDQPQGGRQLLLEGTRAKPDATIEERHGQERHERQHDQAGGPQAGEQGGPQPHCDGQDGREQDELAGTQGDTALLEPVGDPFDEVEALEHVVHDGGRRREQADLLDQLLGIDVLLPVRQLEVAQDLVLPGAGTPQQ